MTTWQKIQLLLRSRKFWVLVAAVITAAGAHVTGQIDAWQMVQTIVAALAVYSTGIALVDLGAANQPPSTNSPSPSGEGRRGARNRREVQSPSNSGEGREGE